MLYTCRSFPSTLLDQYPVLSRPVGKRAGKANRRYLNVVAAFDIETTAINDNYSIMYIWQLQLGLHDTIIGRTWNEFRITVQRLIKDLPKDVYLVLWVHNLAFEFQFLRGIYHFKPEEVFAVQPRRPLRVDMYGHLEFRCSYLHTNMRLEMYLKKMGVEHKKTTLDYSRGRYPWTKLTDAELEYCINDVRGLVEALMIEMAHDSDNLYTIPATSSGYVRRDVKLALRKIRYHQILKLLPDFDTYTLLREAFRGGDTHANRLYAEMVWDNVKSYDRVSSYPDVQMNDEFPMGPFRRYTRPSLEAAERLIQVRHRAVLMRIQFKELRLKYPNKEGCPYISLAKCRLIPFRKIKADNGRLVYSPLAELTVTDVDWQIIKDQYTWDDARVTCLEYARYGQLPEQLKAVIRQYFKLKTELDKSDPQREKAKNKLNAVYGMSAQNPVKQNILFVNNHFTLDPKPPEEILKEANRKAYFCYQWGVWTSALARKRLWEGRKNVTDQGGIFLYCDTDSVKYLDPPDGVVDWTVYNKEREAASLLSGAYADDKKGRRHYMGVYEPDDGYPARFSTRGAKKYVVQHPDGKLEATIAGVNKREDAGHVSGGQELEELGGIEYFASAPSITFKKSGGIELRYNDKDVFVTRIDGHRITVRQCVTIRESRYTLKDTDEYSDMLLDLKELREYLWDCYGRRI